MPGDVTPGEAQAKIALLLIKPVGVHANSWQNRSAYVPINRYVSRWRGLSERSDSNIGASCAASPWGCDNAYRNGLIYAARTIARIRKADSKSTKTVGAGEMLSDQDIERVEAERLDRQMDIAVIVLPVATMLALPWRRWRCLHPRVIAFCRDKEPSSV